MARIGIGGIERKIKEKQAETDKHIDEAFEDLHKLMSKAKDMTQLAQNIANRLKEKGDKDISDDETVLFKSYLLKLGMSEGLEDLVTRKKYANESSYFRDLGKQVGIIVKPLAETNGGQIALTDTFCAVNRARGLDLISAEDLLNACYTFEQQNLGLKLIKYSSGLIVIQNDNYNQRKSDEETLNEIELYYNNTGLGLSAYQLSINWGMTLSLARQRLLNCETCGLACRDESIHVQKMQLTNESKS